MLKNHSVKFESSEILICIRRASNQHILTHTYTLWGMTRMTYQNQDRKPNTLKNIHIKSIEDEVATKRWQEQEKKRKNFYTWYKYPKKYHILRLCVLCTCTQYKNHLLYEYNTLTQYVKRSIFLFCAKHFIFAAYSCCCCWWWCKLKSGVIHRIHACMYEWLLFGVKTTNRQIHLTKHLYSNG